MTTPKREGDATKAVRGVKALVLAVRDLRARVRQLEALAADLDDRLDVLAVDFQVHEHDE